MAQAEPRSRAPARARPAARRPARCCRGSWCTRRGWRRRATWAARRTTWPACRRGPQGPAAAPGVSAPGSLNTRGRTSVRLCLLRVGASVLWWRSPTGVGGSNMGAPLLPPASAAPAARRPAEGARAASHPPRLRPGCPVQARALSSKPSRLRQATAAGPAAVVPEPYPEPAGRAARPTATRDSGRAARRPRWRAPGGCPAGCWSRARSPRSSTTASRATARCGALRVRRRPGAQPPPGWRPVSLHWVQSCPGAAAAFGEECRCGSANFISADGARHALQTLFSWRRHGILASRTACGVVACGSVIRSQQAADLHSPKLAATVQAYSTAVQPALAGSAAAVAYMWG